MNDLGLEGKVVIVTGGASGMGRATAIRFAHLGAKVMVADRNRVEGESCVQEIAQVGGTAAFTQVDIADSASVASMVEVTVQTFGRLDCAFNNAAIHRAHSSITDMNEADWDDTIRVNQSGLFHYLKFELRQMKAQGTGGAIVIPRRWRASSMSPSRLPIPPARRLLSRSAVMRRSKTGRTISGQMRLSPARLTRRCWQVELPLTGKIPAICRSTGRAGKSWPTRGNSGCGDVADRSSFVTGVAIPVDGGPLAR